MKLSVAYWSVFNSISVCWRYKMNQDCEYFLFRVMTHTCESVDKDFGNSVLIQTSITKILIQMGSVIHVWKLFLSNCPFQWISKKKNNDSVTLTPLKNVEIYKTEKCKCIWTVEKLPYKRFWSVRLFKKSLMLTNDAYIFDKNTLKILQNIITVINKGKATFSAATAPAC